MYCFLLNFGLTRKGYLDFNPRFSRYLQFRNVKQQNMSVSPKQDYKLYSSHTEI